MLAAAVCKQDSDMHWLVEGRQDEMGVGKQIQS